MTPLAQCRNPKHIRMQVNAVRNDLNRKPVIRQSRTGHTGFPVMQRCLCIEQMRDLRKEKSLPY